MKTFLIWCLIIGVLGLTILSAIDKRPNEVHYRVEFVDGSHVDCYLATLVENGGGVLEVQTILSDGTRAKVLYSPSQYKKYYRFEATKK